jgi:hypothetical protein
MHRAAFTSMVHRHFTDKSIAEFKYLLHKETWDEVLEPEKPKTAVNKRIKCDSRWIYSGPAFAHGTTGAKRTVGAHPPPST